MIAVLKKYGSIGLKLLGLFVFIYICTRIDLDQVIQSVASASWYHMAGAVLLLIFFHFLKGIRLYYLLKMGKMKISLLNCYLIYVIGLYWGLITPGRMGDFIKAYHIKNHGYAFSEGVSISLVDRILDFFVFILFSGAGLVVLLSHHTVALHMADWIYWFLILVIFIFILLLTNRKKLTGWFSGLSFFEKIKQYFIDFRAYLKEIVRFRNLVFLILFTIFSWFVYLLVVKLLITSFGLNLPFLIVVVFFFISTLITFLPVSYAGIGTRDAALIFLFSLYNYPSEDALRFSFSILFVYLCTIIMGFAANLLKKSPDINTLNSGL